MVNILLESHDINAPWLYPDLKPYIQPHHRVAVVAFSFREDRVKSLSDWDTLYSPDHGEFYTGIVDGFAAYGIPEEHISFLNYFTDTPDSAKAKIKSADIVYFLGGLPDQMMARIKAFDLTETLMAHDGIVMGYSAGAVIQLAEYHLSPDEDYPAFGYYEGLPCLHDFHLEVHYTGSAEQQAAIQKVIAERGKPVYALAHMKGAIIFDEGEVNPIGEVTLFQNPPHTKTEATQSPHRLRKIYAVLTAVLLLVEICIALFVRDRFIRPYGGDILVTLLLCCFARIFIPQKLRLMPLLVFVFAALVEVGQYFDFAALLGLADIPFFSVLLGRSFSAADLLCYAAGCVLFFLVEYLLHRLALPQK